MDTFRIDVKINEKPIAQERADPETPANEEINKLSF